jgi:hypothetical protein
MPIELASSAQAAAPGAELGQIAHQGRRFRRREAGFDQRIREAGAERTDDGARLRVGAGDALADRRLAIGAGDGDQRQPFARVTIDHVASGPASGRRASTGNSATVNPNSRIKIAAGCQSTATAPRAIASAI